MSSCLMFGKCNRGWSDAYDLTKLSYNVNFLTNLTYNEYQGSLNFFKYTYLFKVH